MKIRVGINGFGRIGRSVFRLLDKDPNIEVVGINDLFAPSMLAYLLKYDSVMGVYDRPVRCDLEVLHVGGKQIPLSSQKDPAKIPWGGGGCDVVLECTGKFTKRADLQKHLQPGVKRVLLTVPPADDIDNMVVLGVNDQTLKASHRLVSNASCTTNCLAPLAKVVDEAFGIESGIMTTVHAYTNDQRLNDSPHKDPRRSRAAGENIIPTTTGAARAVGKVLPHLAGKLDGMATRVPVINGSIIDLVVKLRRAASAEAINLAVQQAADGPMRGILEYTSEPLVSHDIIGNPHSSIFDSSLTQGTGDGFARLVSWYDNEWGYSNRCLELVKRLAAFG
jgi:glyceraldehyde 3-phosphate dehydrogenase